MGTVSVSLPSDGTTAYVADYNTPITTIVNEFNGNIDNANIKSGAAISGSKLASNSIDLGAKASVWDGWILVSDSWTYSSWDSTNKTGVITVPTDATTKYSAGMRGKITQSTGGTKYFIVTAVSSTTLTGYFGTDYTLNNEAISSPYYSPSRAPLSFPLSPEKWTVTATSSNDRSPGVSSSLVSFTDTIVVPIGLWRLTAKLSRVITTATLSYRLGYLVLSSDGSTDTNPNTTMVIGRGGETTAASSVGGTATCEDLVSVATATTFTLMGRVSSTTGVSSFAVRGSADTPTVFKAISAYL